MTDYASLKVPELKKLLQEKQLPVTGNKADLIARLHEHDKASEEPKAPAATVSTEEDPIDYSDDDVPASKTEPATEPAATEQKAAESVAPATEPATEAKAVTSEDKTAEPATVDEAKPTDEAAATDSVPKVDFSANLPATSADEEARKRAARAKRFGIVDDADEEAKKKSERAHRFGVEQSSLVSGLDSALPEKRERKRGREATSNSKVDGERGAKRQQNGQGRRRGGGKDSRNRGGRSGGGDRGPSRREVGGGKPKGVLSDPSERAKAEARAKRFGGDA
ncbi:hypothetical protein GGS21DRAFT_485647 [Xylaria nigripes]|nr:hypothetical protein GGS21DRAFT_485647 [Xylaria nigripes]